MGVVLRVRTVRTALRWLNNIQRLSEKTQFQLSVSLGSAEALVR